MDRMGYLGMKNRVGQKVSKEESELILEAWDCVKVPETETMPEYTTFKSLAIFLNLLNKKKSKENVTARAISRTNAQKLRKYFAPLVENFRSYSYYIRWNN